jgi:hypothetical protein
VLHFICPKCKGTQLEEIMKYATIFTPIVDIEESGEPVLLDPSLTIEGEVVGFRCGGCKHIIRDNDTGSVVTYYLTIRQMFGEKK